MNSTNPSPTPPADPNHKTQETVRTTSDGTPLVDAPISLFIAVYNQEQTLDAVLSGWMELLTSLGRNFEALVVDDASTDGSLTKAETFATKEPRFRVFQHTRRSGYGAAMRTAIDNARLPLFAFTAADSRYRPSDMAKLLQWMNRVDLVTGYRVDAAGAHSRNWPQRWYWLLNRACFAVRLRDLPCTFGLARRDIFERIPIQSHSIFAIAEVIAKANFLGHVMTELPIQFQEAGLYVPWTEPMTQSRILAEMWRVFAHPSFGAGSARLAPPRPLSEAISN